jgi:hypothetical protein
VLNFDGIISSTLAWDKAQLHSYLGFQPYTFNTNIDDYKYNFMYQLKAKGLIDYNVISFNIRSEYGFSSYVKFGGYDDFALKDGNKDELKLFRTRNTKYWHLPLAGILAGDGGFSLRIEFIENLELDPSVRYMYVPARLFSYKNYVKPIEESFNSDNKNTTGGMANCDDIPVCYYKKSCDSIIKEIGNNFLTIRIS